MPNFPKGSKDVMENKTKNSVVNSDSVVKSENSKKKIDMSC